MYISDFYVLFQEIVVKTADLIQKALVHTDWIMLQRYLVNLIKIKLYIYVFSEEDIVTVKTSLYLFKKISLRILRHKDYENIKPVISLVLVATSRICSNSSISGNKLIEVKEKVTINLIDTVTVVTTAKLKFSIFNVRYMTQGKAEVQVRDSLLLGITVNIILHFIL